MSFPGSGAEGRDGQVFTGHRFVPRDTRQTCAKRCSEAYRRQTPRREIPASHRQWFRPLCTFSSFFLIYLLVCVCMCVCVCVCVCVYVCVCVCVCVCVFAFCCCKNHFFFFPPPPPSLCVWGGGGGGFKLQPPLPSPSSLPFPKQFWWSQTFHLQRGSLYFIIF